MNDAWDVMPLGELCDVLDHKRKPITKRDREAGEYPYYGATGVLDHVAGYLFDEPLVLVGEDGAKWGSGANTAFAVKGKVWVNNHAHVLRPNRDKLLDRWLIYHLNHSDLTVFVSGLTVPKLNQGSLREIPVPVPPLPEQQRIVALLEEAFAGLATAKTNAERNVQNANQLYESLFQSFVDQRGEEWEETTLSEATGGIFTGPFGSLLHKSDYIEGGIPLVNPAHIKAAGIEPDLRKTVSSETAKRLKSYILSSGDIVIGRRGEMGRCAVVTEREDGWLCGTGSFFIKPSARCDPRYVAMYLRSRSCKSALECIAGGAVMPNLSNSDLGNLPLRLPPLSKQLEIVERVDCLGAQIQRLTHIFESKLIAAKDLKKSILRRAFNGDL
ncbi:restriction endonuclease subunit S [Synechococcus sp. LTW-G]